MELFPVEPVQIKSKSSVSNFMGAFKRKTPGWMLPSVDWLSLLQLLGKNPLGLQRCVLQFTWEHLQRRMSGSAPRKSSEEPPSTPLRYCRVRRRYLAPPARLPGDDHRPCPPSWHKFLCLGAHQNVQKAPRGVSESQHFQSHFSQKQIFWHFWSNMKPVISQKQDTNVCSKIYCFKKIYTKETKTLVHSKFWWDLLYGVNMLLSGLQPASPSSEISPVCPNTPST